MTVYMPEQPPTFDLTLTISDDLDHVRQIAKAAAPEFDVTFSANSADRATVELSISHRSQLSPATAAGKLSTFIANFPKA